VSPHEFAFAFAIARLGLKTQTAPLTVSL
jgi:hypothetical protein